MQGRTSRDCVPAHQVRQIRTEASRPIRTAHCVTIYARSCFKNTPPRTRFVVVLCRLFLSLDPRSELFGAIDRHSEQHLPVLRSAVLRTLADVDASLVRVDPCVIYAIREQVCLPRKFRKPTALIAVRGN